MARALERPSAQEIKRRYGSEIDVEALTGISRKTLQKDRLLNRQRFPWYKSGRRVLYDLSEVEATIRAAAGGIRA
jgi:predicted DNA-binding transcriptional regulator AlpA